MKEKLVLSSNSEAKTLEVAAKLGQVCQNYKQLMIYLDGDLGAGKTTFARGFIGFFGFKEVKSPTYSLVESYKSSKGIIHHFDLYRLADFEELEYIGIREYIQNLCLVEWAQNGYYVLPEADLLISLSNGPDKIITIFANNNLGLEIMQKIKTS